MCSLYHVRHKYIFVWHEVFPFNIELGNPVAIVWLSAFLLETSKLFREKFFSFRVRCFNWYVNDRFNNFNIGEDQGNYPTDTIVFFGCIEYRPPNRQCFGTDMRCYIYVLLKFTVPTKCWLLEQVTSAQTERAAEHIPMLWIRVTS